MSIFSNHYYHRQIETLIASFGAFFSDMRVVKLNADGTRNQEIKVPIAFGPKNKWLERLTAQPDPANGPNVEITLPRLAYEITDYRYDSTRKVGYKGYYSKGVSAAGDNVKVFNPVPYTVSIQLHSMCKDNQTSLQILEQILPYFSPAVTMSVMMLPDYNLVKDVPITLTSVSVEDTYEGSRENFRVVTQTFEFTAKIDLFGPINDKGGLIKNTDVNVGNFDPNYAQRNNDQIVNPFTAAESDVYTIDETWINLPQ